MSLWAFIMMAAGISSPCTADSRASFGGYSKTFAAVSWPPRVESSTDSPPAWSVHDALRLKLGWTPSEAASLNLAWSLAPQVRNPSSTAGQSSSARRYRIDDVRQRLCPWGQAGGRHFTVEHNIDRAYLRLSRGPADVFIGRQAVAWGSARAVNPTDVVAPYPFTELDSEERVGVDALRAVIQLGGISYVEAGAVAGRGLHADSSAAFLRAKTHWGPTDVAPCVALYRGHLMSGLDLAGSLAGAGAWLEAAYTKYDTKGSQIPGSANSWRLSAGCDYRASNSIFLSLEYHYNGDGEPGPGSYARNERKPGYRDGPVYLMGRHYLVPSLAWQMHPLVGSSTIPFVNLSDRSLLLAQSLEYNATQDSYLSIGAYISLGKKRWLEDPGLSFGSEFGNYPLMTYISYGLYF